MGSIPAGGAKKPQSAFVLCGFFIKGIGPERVWALRKQSGGLFLAKSGEGVNRADSMLGVAEADSRPAGGAKKEPESLYFTRVFGSLSF